MNRPSPDDMKAMWVMEYVQELEKENEKLKDEVDIAIVHNLLLIEENKKLKDEFMLRLAEAYLLPPTSNQMAEYKKWDYSKWYDEIKNQMRKEIKKEG